MKARYVDVRGWLEAVEQLGELRTVGGADWDLELGAVVYMAAHAREAKPALLFDDIEGYPAGYRVLCSTMNSMRRLALTCGLPLDIDAHAFIREWHQLVNRSTPLPPALVQSSPVTQNVQDDDEVDLMSFPAPRWFSKDGGRYIGTAALVMTRDPETSELNMGCYRVMIHDRSRLGLMMSPHSGGSRHMRAWFALGKDCPIAISFGHDPLLLIAAAERLPANKSELAWVGGIRGEPVDVIAGPVTGLPIPWSSEVAVEGFLLRDETRQEGPFGEFTGYNAGSVEPQPVMRVSRLVHRDDPIILGSPRSRPPDDATFWQTKLKASAIWRGLNGAGVPSVKAVWCHVNSYLFVVVSIKQEYAGHARQAGLIAQQCAAGIGMGRWVVVVDEDIDVSDLSDVLWAMSTRADPGRALEVITYSTNIPLDSARRPGDKLHAARCVVDACRPWEWRDEFPVVAEPEPDLLRDVEARWRNVLWPG